VDKIVAAVLPASLLKALDNALVSLVGEAGLQVELAAQELLGVLKLLGLLYLDGATVRVLLLVDRALRFLLVDQSGGSELQVAAGSRVLPFRHSLRCCLVGGLRAKDVDGLLYLVVVTLLDLYVLRFNILWGQG